jgi:RNA polymerase sigma-70 factor (ECF subfamily)
MSSKSLETLVALAQAGDKTAFATVLRRTTPEMRAVIRAFVPIEDVDDMLQEVHTHLWKHLHQYTQGNFRAWLAVVTRRATIDALRREATRVETKRVDPDRLVRKNATPDALIAKLREALPLLSPREREMIVQHYFFGFRCAEIAEREHISVRTVETLLLRARRKIKECITKAE